MTEQRSGRIVKALSGFYYVDCGGEVVECRARGIFRKEHITPLVGDYVTFSVERGKGTLETIAPRKNSFLRPAVSNLDALVVLASGANPVTDPFLIDRVCAIAGDRGVPVLLCVNKVDLAAAEQAVKLVRPAPPARGTRIARRRSRKDTWNLPAPVSAPVAASVPAYFVCFACLVSLVFSAYLFLSFTVLSRSGPAGARERRNSVP